MGYNSLQRILRAGCTCLPTTGRVRTITTEVSTGCYNVAYRHTVYINNVGTGKLSYGIT